MTLAKGFSGRLTYWGDDGQAISLKRWALARTVRRLVAIRSRAALPWRSCGRLRTSTSCSTCKRLELHFVEGLRRLQKKYTFITDVRGRGLMVAAELDRPAGIWLGESLWNRAI